MLTDAITYTVDQISTIIAQELREPYTRSDNLRTAAMYSPYVMTTAHWVEACARHGINAGAARNRLNEVRRFQREMGELA